MHNRICCKVVAHKIAPRHCDEKLIDLTQVDENVDECVEKGDSFLDGEYTKVGDL
jgi:hypothetical protein